MSQGEYSQTVSFPLVTTLATEADVEQKVLFPLLTHPALLRIPAASIRAKEYLAAAPLDKRAGSAGGYYPDFSVWEKALPLLVVEAKAPDVDVAVGYREASLYARHLNQSYRTGLNPCGLVLSCNGEALLVGHWDSQPEAALAVVDLRPGTSALSKLQELCAHDRILANAEECQKALSNRDRVRPYSLAGGQAVINSKKPFNTFAAGLSPILRKYFTSKSQDSDPEIYERAYVSSDAVTEYDRVLESLLKDRVGARGSMTLDLEPTRRKEPKLQAAIHDYNETHPADGQLQLITGGVGVGKSLFARRFKELLQAPSQSEYTHWAFVDFNGAPASLQNAETWVCEAFLSSFQDENPEFDLFEPENTRRFFSHDIQKRRSVYAQYKRASAARAQEARASDLQGWLDDPQKLAFSVCRYFSSDKHETVVAVFDNVDRLDLENQLAAFQLALWFLSKSRSFVILQMRDETYERYKNRPPLDTFRSGVSFHITPPRFLDVVKRRLELSLDYLVHRADSRQEYHLSNGTKVSYPKTLLGQFLSGIYLELFERQNNVARILQGIAGRDVRRALEMFVAILTSGHLREETITSAAISSRAVVIPEYMVLKILMRTEYRFFNDASGFVTNVFFVDDEWERPTNFLFVEIVFWLYRNRKKQGSIGLEGYHTVADIADALQPLGYIREDVLSACGFLVQRQLIEPDHMNISRVDVDDAVKVTASGFIHVRILCERLEYLYGVLAVTSMFDRKSATAIARFVESENRLGYSPSYRMVECVERFRAYLSSQYKGLKQMFPGYAVEPNGASYVISQIDSAIAHSKRRGDAKVRRNVMDE
ncbi:MAG: hypothetical protein OXI55_05965 [Gammaproteobacteria bacterium]|nr:hypothetical protein [Gammaproteobacteria bacterium]